jgi:hypothetical protein
MNIYVVVEGEQTEKQVYRAWIRFVNPTLNPIETPDRFSKDKYYILASHGYPFVLESIEGAVADVVQYGNVDRLVIAVDSEDRSREQRFTEIEQHLARLKCPIASRVVVQHFCFETWALGNRKIVGRNVQDHVLRSYIRIYNVVKRDPELLPSYPSREWNRAQFAFAYLKSSIHDKHRNLSYSKNNPGVVIERSFFDQVVKRNTKTEHIQSFRDFLAAFV